MSEHHAAIEWAGGAEPFTLETYSRDHTWTFPNGTRVDASSAPAFRGNDARVDPEEAFVASVASCHMLTFLAVAASRKLVVSGYEDAAVGFLEKNAEGRLAMTRVILRPKVAFGGETTPTPDQLEELHKRAHRGCFIANSVRTDITVEDPAG